jgi:hypothetical protein
MMTTTSGQRWIVGTRWRPISPVCRVPSVISHTQTEMNFEGISEYKHDNKTAKKPVEH